MNLKNIFQSIREEVKKRQFEISFVAPFFFFLVALLRCYLESQIFSARPYFSYFVALHHVLWYFTVILYIILITHIILKVAVEKLLWLMYGAILLMIPIIVVIIQDKPMSAGYLTGTFWEIAVHIFTIYFTYEKNLPLTPEVILIFIGMTAVGYLYSGSLLRGIALGTAIYFGGNLLAISWISRIPNGKAVFIVLSALQNHPFMAAVYAHAVTFFSFLMTIHAGLIKGNSRYLFLSAAMAIMVGCLYMTVVALSGWFYNPIDIFLTALPFWTTALLVTLWRYRQQIPMSRWFWVIGLTVLFFQCAVLGPIYFHIGVANPTTALHLLIPPLRPH